MRKGVMAGVAAGAACADGPEEEGHGDVAWASAAVETAVDSLDDQQALVAKLWKKSGVTLSSAAP